MFPSQQLGRYHLLDRIAVGGMAEIFRAVTFDSQGNRYNVAIKRVLKSLAEDDEFLQMLVDEAKIAILLNGHPHIANVYEFVRIGHEYFIAMEYVEGKDLRAILDRCRSEEIGILPQHCAYILICILDALDAVHETHDGTGTPLKIVHRDVSPSNIIVSYDGQVKLCDFGIAKTKRSRVQTRTGVIKGKIRYMSPEQTMGRTLDRRSDIFSAGSVLFEMLTQDYPFQGTNEMEVVLQIRDAKFTPPSLIDPKAPKVFDKFLKRAMARSRRARYQTAKLFAKDLIDYLGKNNIQKTSFEVGLMVQKLFEDDIKRQNQKLQQFIIKNADPSALGENLLANAMDRHAPYTKFTPLNPLKPLKSQTLIFPKMPEPESRLQEGMDLHDLKTHIIDPQERKKNIIKRKSRPDENNQQNKNQETELKTIKRPIEKSPGREKVDADLANQPTKILKRDKE